MHYYSPSTASSVSFVDSIQQYGRISVVVLLLGVCPDVSQAERNPGKFFSGQDTIGAIFTAHNEGGELISLRVQNVEADPHDPELSLYTMFAKVGPGSAWQNLCAADSNGVTKAIPLTGYWDKTGNHVDSESVTFACTGGVLAKCVRWGYKPWIKINGYSARSLHQTCTRMARADYCGNGVAHTQNGTPINIYDRAEIQRHTLLDSMEFEAGWNSDGAVVLSRTRFPGTLQKLRTECPDKLNKILTNKADNKNNTLSNSQDVLIYNESIPR